MTRSEPWEELREAALHVDRAYEALEDVGGEEQEKIIAARIAVREAMAAIY